VKQLRLQYKRHVLKPREWHEAVYGMLPIVGSDLPTRVIGWTKNGIWSRIEATYPNGGVANIYFKADGTLSSAKFKSRIMNVGVPIDEAAA